MDVLKFFGGLIIAQIFFAVGVGIFNYSTPSEANDYVVNIYGINSVDIKGLQEQLQSSLSEQSSMPLVDLGALAFYSGNVLLDLILNFALAVPQMATIVFQTITIIFNIDPTIMSWVQTFAFVTFTALYFLGLITLMASIRTGRIGSPT